MNESPRELLEFLARSDDRVTVLAALATGASFTRAELRTETGIPRSTVSRILDEFLGVGLVSRVDYRYEVTPFGGIVTERLHSIFNAIEAIQRLQLLVNRLSDADPDVTFTDQTSSEILTPTSEDPRAPARRFADLLQAASHVRLVVPAAIPVLFDVDPAIRSGKQTFDIVIPRVVRGAEKDCLTSPQQLRGVIASGDVTLFSYDGDIPHFVGTIDETAAVGLIDDAGTMQGYIETGDERVRSWTEAAIETYMRGSDRITRRALTERGLSGRCC